MVKKVLHRQKLFGGRETAEEVHAKHAFPAHARCICGARPMIRCIIMMELSEARKQPAIDMMMLVNPQVALESIVQIKGSDGKAIPYWRCSVTYACKQHKKLLHQSAAKAPSHCIVEFNEGPGPDKIITSGSIPTN